MVRVKDFFYDHENAKANDPRKSITRRLRLTKIDADMPKEGIVLEAIKADEKQPSEEQGMSTSPMLSTWIASGLAVAAVIGFAGFWFSRRNGRREA